MRDEARTPIFLLVERLRLTYGGKTLNGPWPRDIVSEMGAPHMCNKPKHLATDCNIGLSEICKLSGFSLEDKVYLIKEFEKLASVIFPEDRLIRCNDCCHR